MIEIKDLLNKWNGLLLSEEVKKEKLRNIISKILGVEINKEDVKIKKDTVYLNIKPIYKSEVLLKKDKIIRALEEVLGKKTPQEIR